MLRIALIVGCIAGVHISLERRAHAFAACGNGEGWALKSGTTVPPHAHLVYYLDGRRQPSQANPTIAATIDGMTVPVKLTFVTAAPFELAMVEIDSDKTGKLALEWGKATKANAYFQPNDPRATYTIAKVKLPAEAKGTTSRFHKAYHHSTVHELDDGLQIAVDVPAVAFTARWRRDDKQAWQTLEMTATTANDHQVARMGSLGCSTNFPVMALENGIDLELTALLPDGNKVKVTGLPAHIVLAPLPKNAPQSSP